MVDDQNYINRREEEQRRASVESDRTSWFIPMAAGIGAIGLGAYIFRSRLAEGGELTSNIFNFLGLPKGINLSSDLAANTGGSAIRGSNSGIRSVLNSIFDVKKKTVQLGPIDIIDDLRNSIELIGMTDREIASHISEKTIEYTNRRLSTGGNNTGFFPFGLQRVTFGQVLQDQATWSNVIGARQVSILEKARSLGLVEDSMALDNRIFFDPKTNTVFDRRLRNLVSKVTSTNVNGEEVVRRVGKFDLFGQAKVIESIFGLPNKGVAVLGPSQSYAGSRVFIGGNVYGYSFNKSTGQYNPITLATNRTLRRAGDALEPIAASRQGRLELKVKERSGFFGSMLSSLEESTGVGPSFSNRPSFLNRWVIDPYRRFQALRSGEGVIIKNPYKKNFGISKTLDAALGGEMPELSRLGGTTIPVPGGSIQIPIQQLRGNSMFFLPNRVAVLFDLADDYSIVKKSSYDYYKAGIRKTLIGDDLVVAPRKGGFKIHGKRVPESSPAFNLTDIDRGELSAAGFRSSSATYAYYDVGSKVGRGHPFVAGVRDFLSYSIYRINSLASESLLGIGFAPSHKIGTNIARLAALPIAYQTGLKTAEYADYLTEKFTGVSPKKFVASLYAGARLAQQKIRELTGIRATSDFLDTYFPGSINSDGSMLARSILAPAYAASMVLGKGNFMGAAIAAAGVYGAIGGPEPNQTASDLAREYSGDKKVPVRKGAFWGLGYLPFTGGKVERYDTSWYAKLTSDYREKALYGSKSEYWSYHANIFGIPFPTPSNLFGVLNVINPYRLESKHYYDRPYSQTGSDLESFPIIGPALAATVGQLFKPTRYREPTSLPLLKAGLADRGLTAQHAKEYGISAMDATAYEAEDPTTPMNTLLRQANIATEPLGIYKFALEFFGVKFSPDIGTQFSTSSEMSDPGRYLYDLGIGGALGQTELIRRFFLSDYSSQYRRGANINPIENSLPKWLPGAYSESKRDRDYFIDFTMGDAYSKITDGEARLPGAGYEALNKLHSGIEGNYDPVDRFLILSDVAPYSNAYKSYQKMVSNMELEPEWRTRVEEAMQQRQEVIGVDTRYKRYEEDLVALNMGIVSKSIYAPLRKGYDFLTHDILAEIPYLGSKLFPFRSPYEQYRKMYVEGSEFASWDYPWEDIIRPGLYDMALEDPFTAAGKGAVVGALMSGPMRWFTPFRSIVGEAGGHMLNMAAVKGGALFGAGLSALRIGSMQSQDMIPYHLRAEEDAIQYMDTINYIRGRGFASAGLPNPGNTMLGASNPIQYRSALPKSADRRYFDYFSTIEDKEIQAQILRGTPSYINQGLSSVWGGGFLSNFQKDEIALDFVNNNQIPDSNWLGWDPQVSNSATRLRLIDHGINGISENIHRFGFYESHEVDLKTRLKVFNDQEINFTQSPIYSSFDGFLKTHLNKLTNKESYRISNIGTPLGARKEVTVKVNRDRENREALRQVFR